MTDLSLDEQRAIVEARRDELMRGAEYDVLTIGLALALFFLRLWS